MTTVAHPPTQGYRTIRFPLLEHEYERVLADRDYAKSQLQEISKSVFGIRTMRRAHALFPNVCVDAP